MGKFKQIKGSTTAPLGFRAAACFCNVKTLGTGKGSNKGQKNDLALIVSDAPSKAAGMFTTNQVCAAPVKVCIEHLKNNTAQAVVVNSGNANACTGPQGIADAREMVTLTGQALGIRGTNVLVGSTGRIGVHLPMANVRRGIAEDGDAGAVFGKELGRGLAKTPGAGGAGDDGGAVFQKHAADPCFETGEGALPPRCQGTSPRRYLKAQRNSGSEPRFHPVRDGFDGEPVLIV